ncbi:hypothetical protein LSAT2_000712 [Lamellibrachia satsuma]|nr:hypothetical protein LSAT2_000712 [Lamellibrachia satsuma]
MAGSIRRLLDGLAVKKLLDGEAVKGILDGVAFRRLLDRAVVKRLLDGLAVKKLLDGEAVKGILDGVAFRRLLDRVVVKRLLDGVAVKRPLYGVAIKRLLDGIAVKRPSCWSDPNIRPGKPSLNTWPLHTPHGQEYLELNVKYLNEPDKSRAVSRGPRTKECAFWKRYLPRLVISTGDLVATGRAKPPQLNNTVTCATQTSHAGHAAPASLLMGLVLVLTSAQSTLHA